MVERVTAFKAKDGKLCEDLEGAVTRDLMLLVHQAAAGERGQTISQKGAELIVQNAEKVVETLQPLI